MALEDENSANRSEKQRTEPSAKDGTLGFAEIAPDIAGGAGGISFVINPQSKHISDLLLHRVELKQELAKHDAALVPIIEAVEQTQKQIEEKTAELRSKESRLAAREYEASQNNSVIRAEIDRNNQIIEEKTKSNSASLDDFCCILASVFTAGGVDVPYLEDRLAKRNEELRSQLTDVSSARWDVERARSAIKPYADAYRKNLSTKEEIEKRRTYEVFTQLVLNEHAVKTSSILEHYATDSGTSLDAVLGNMDNLAKPFVDGGLTRKTLDAAIEWAKTERGNVDMPPEQMAFKQFVNRMVIPHIGSFEAYASMIDDLNKTGIESHQPLELLKQKTISFSGTKPSTELALPSEKKRAKGEARELAESLPAVKIDAIIDSPNPIAVRVADAVGENETHLQGFEGLFAGVEKKIDDLLANANEKEARRQELTELATTGRARNERIDLQIGQSQFDQQARLKRLPPDKPKVLRVLSQGLKRGIDALLIGGAGGAAAGSVVPGAGTIIGGVTGAAGGLVGGALWGMGEGALDLIAIREKGLTKHGELAVRQELIDYLRSQKVDIDKYNLEIDEISQQLTDLVKSKEYQAEVGSQLKAERIMKAYVARSLLRSGWQNTNLLAETCEQNGIESLDAFVNAFNGEVSVSLKRFCFGLANSNDMSLILAEADALSGDQLKPHECALKDFVENIIKPDIGGYLSKASKVDVISQSNLLPYGAPLECTKGIIRDENDPKLAALVANEFGMSVVGLQDVKHVFDFYLHRHGDRQLYDAKLKDGQMTDQYPAKRISVYPPEEVDRFVDMTKQSMSHGRKTQPQVSDMFLRVCAYEYFMPQAVRTAGTDNVFSENPEAPAAYPMVNATVNKFIEEMSLGPIQKYRELVGERLDNVIAQTFIDYFATLGAMHLDDSKIKPLRKNLRDAGNTEDYGPVFSVYTRKISNDSSGRFELFMDIYRHNLEKQIEVSTEEDRTVLKAHLLALPDPSKTILTPNIMKPGSHRARLLAAYEDHTLENLSKKPDTGGQER